MLDKEFGKQSKHSILVSLPMYCYFSNLMIEEVPFERLFIKLRDPNNKEQIKFLTDRFKDLMEAEKEEDKYEVWS